MLLNKYSFDPTRWKTFQLLVNVYKNDLIALHELANNAYTHFKRCAVVNIPIQGFFVRV